MVDAVRAVHDAFPASDAFVVVAFEYFASGVHAGLVFFGESFFLEHRVSFVLVSPSRWRGLWASSR